MLFLSIEKSCFYHNHRVPVILISTMMQHVQIMLAVCMDAKSPLPVQQRSGLSHSEIND